MIDPVSAGALKAVASAVPATIKAVAQEWARRDADTRPFASLEPELDEALDVLTAAVDPWAKALVGRAKAVLSGVPEIFAQPHVGLWLGQPATRAAVKSAVMALVRSRDPVAAAAHAADAAAIDAALREAATVAFDYAVAFVARSLDRKMSVGERIAVDRFDALSAQVSELAQAAGQAAAPTGLQLELLDREAVAAIERMRKRRFLHDADRTADAADVAMRLTSGNLRTASTAVRARGLAICARVRALEDSDENARTYLRLSQDLGAGEEALIADAFLASRESEAAGLRKLHPIETDARREAALVIVKSARGPAEAIGWARAAGVDAGRLTPDGQQFLLHYMLEADDWTGAYDMALVLTPEAFDQAPTLLHHAGLARLGAVVPADLRFLVRNGPPFDAATFRLADGAAALDDRRAAAALFEQAAAATEALDAPRAADLLRAYALWLRLRDPETAEAAKADLTAGLGDGERGLSLIPLAIAFRLQIDRNALSRELDRLEALDPEGSPEAAVARFALLNIPENVEEGLSELRRLKPRIAKYIVPLALLNLEFGLLVALGRQTEAAALLHANAETIGPTHLRRLEADLAPEGEGPTLEDLEAWYASEPTSLNLRRLVDRLARGAYTPRFFELARKLVASTHAVVDAEAVAERLIGMERHDDAATLLAEIDDLIPASLDLRGAKAWSDYRQGDVRAAWTRLSDLRAAREDRNDRALLANILIASGRWPELVRYVEDEWQHRHERSAEQLVELAQLAAALRSPRLMGLVQLAAEAAPDSADIQLASYSLCVSAGLEADDRVGVWLKRAIELSDENGPVTPANLQDLVDRAGDWRKRTDDVWTKLRAGQLPLFVGAKLLHRSGLELQLVPLITNPSEPDPRRRSVVPAFSGVRAEIGPGAATVALDGSAVVTLGVLGQLEAAVNRPGGIILPHVLLSWLFAERQKLRVHQPSRIRDARALIQALAAKRLHAFAATAPPPTSLADQVGADLAEMLVSAREATGEGPQRLVVRPGPVTRIGSFVGEEVALDDFSSQLVSCAAVVDKLLARGHVTQAEADKAHAYLTRQSERRWPNEPDIADDAVLYLDDLATSYLRTIGVLERLRAAGLTAMVAAGEIEEANVLLEMDAWSGEIDAAIERIRDALADGIAEGKVTLAPMVDGDDLTAHPNLAVTRATPLAEVLVSDDRYINKNRFIDQDGHRSEVWTSLELLEALNRAGQVSDADVARARYDLRRGGVIFIPPTTDELIRLIAGARTLDGILQETAELRAFRENLELAQMRGWLQIPNETAWLHRLQATTMAALIAQWAEDISEEDARARSAWLLQRGDVRNWAGLEDHVDPSGLSTVGLALALDRVLLAVHDIPHAPSARRLEQWLQSEVIEPLQDEDPDAYAWMIAHLRELILHTASGEGPDDGE